MKRITAPLLAGCLLCALLAGCTTSHSYSSPLVRQGVRELKRGHDCIESITLDYLRGNEDNLNIECVFDEAASVSDMMAAYDAIGGLFSGDEFLTEFCEWVRWDHPLEPAGPIRTVNSGPALDIRVLIGGYSTSVYYSSTRSETYTDERGWTYNHVYEGWPEWPRPLIFHRESFTGEPAPAEDIPAGAQLLSFDFDRDGEDETAVSFADGGAARVWMLEAAPDGALRRELLTDALTDYALGLCGVTDGWDHITVRALGEVYSREKNGGPDYFNEAHELEPYVEICAISVGAGGISVTFDICVRDSTLGVTELYGEADLALYYDAGLGFRIGDGGWAGTANGQR